MCVCADDSDGKGQDRYVLSEMQVMGRGGLKAQAAVSPHTSDGKCSLDGGDWTLQTGFGG